MLALSIACTAAPRPANRPSIACTAIPRPGERDAPRAVRTALIPATPPGDTTAPQ